jgi:diacylglycerol kinase (ATP)
VSAPSIVVIAHPGAGRGAFARSWPPVARALDTAGLAYRVSLTDAASTAAPLARRAMDEGARLVVAVGGDGTLHEVVNGLLDGRERLEDAVAVGLLPAGRGSDYARGIGLPREPSALVARIAAALDGDPSATRRVDVGEVRYGQAGTVRRFINAAGMGFSPFVARRTARLPASGPYLYTVAALATIIDWRDRRLELRWDDGHVTEQALESLEVLLGPYEGGGMLVAPGADPTDGQLDVLLLGAVSRLEMLTFAWRVRSGRHLSSSAAAIRRCTGLAVRVVDGRGPVHLQADGELLGSDPCEFRVLPAALRFVW